MLRVATIVLLSAVICWAEDPVERPTKLACFYGYDADQKLIVVRIFNCGSEPVFIEEIEENGVLRRINKDGEVDYVTTFCDDPRFETQVYHNRRFIELPPVQDMNAKSLEGDVTDRFLLKCIQIQIDTKNFGALGKDQRIAFEVERDIHCGRPLVAQLEGEVRIHPEKGHSYFKPLTFGNGLVRPIKPIPATKGGAEQDSAEQPATAPESEPEGKEEPKPESEGRSQ